MKLEKLKTDFPEVFKALENEWGDPSKVNSSIKKIIILNNASNTKLWYVKDSTANYYIVKGEKDKYIICETLEHLKLELNLNN